MVFRSSSWALRSLLGKKEPSAPKPPKRSSTPRRDGKPSGFRIVVPDYCRPGQVICVQGPDGQQVEVTVPANVGPGQAMWVQVQPQAASSAHSMPSSNPEEEADAMIRILEQEACSACEFAQRRLLEEMQMQMALWASTEGSGEGEGDQLQVAASQPELSQTQATLLAAAEEGNAVQLLAALSEAKKFSVVSLSLEEAAKGLREAEESMLTWRCLRQAVKDSDRHEIEVWMEHAASLGLDVPGAVEQVLVVLRGREQELLRSLEKRRDVEQRLEFAKECGDPELLAQVRQEAAFIGIDTAGRSRGSESQSNGDDRDKEAPPKPPPPPASDRPAPAREEDPRSTRDLLEECRRRGLDTSGCQVREDLLNLLRAPPEPRSEPRPARTSSSGPSSSGSARPSASQELPPDRPPPTRPPVPKAQPPQVGTVWDRETVPPRYLIHKRYEALFLLGLDPGRLPSASELRSAYRKAALECHPDRQQNHARQEEAKKLFQRVKDAFDHLSTVVR